MTPRPLTAEEMLALWKTPEVRARVDAWRMTLDGYYAQRGGETLDLGNGLQVRAIWAGWADGYPYLAGLAYESTSPPTPATVEDDRYLHLCNLE